MNIDEREEMLGRLAKALFGRMKHLEPSIDPGKQWDDLNEFEREFYVASVETVLCACPEDIKGFYKLT